MAIAAQRETDLDGARVLLLLRGRNADMVRHWLGDSVTVLTPSPRLPPEFDLCILDASSLAAYEDELVARKEETGDVFLPYLLVVNRGPGLYSRLEVRRLVDDVLTVPAEPAELALRIRSLIRTRQQSLLLKERKEEEVKELRRQNERLDQFASIVSHDIRNPLTVAGGAVELTLATGELEHLELATEAVSKMHDLVEKVLDLSRKGRLVDETSAVELAEAAEDAWRYVPSEGGRLVVEDSYELQADRKRFEDLLSNLFRNSLEHGATGDLVDAVDAVEEGESAADEPAGEGRSPSATIRVGPIYGTDGTGDVVGFYVEDDGPGIPEGAREDVFEFGYTTNDGGTGFGLAIVESIALAHGWTPSVTAAESGGARFEFRHDPVS